jgi:hypothetical protein
MVDLGGETDLGWLEGIITGEMDADAEDTATERALGGSHDHTLPRIQVLALGTTATTARGILGHIG